MVLDTVDILRWKMARKNLRRSRYEARCVLNAYADKVARPNALMHLPHEERVDLMPSYTFSAGKWPESVNTYIICLEEYKSQDTLRFMLPCRHDFHQPCIDKWLRHAVSCPLCRQSVFLPEPPLRRLSEEEPATGAPDSTEHT
ncbi:RING-H2 finger protein ATL70-like [Rosa chinensis]|uniref:RING-H2 finger protein ATL70-like n=1 Tax=Rosa chinensis TaxID=74649 RepID=UPI000D08E3D7|nr:RING-H2 finger protein ATL70-like [Rosa chinensis]